MLVVGPIYQFYFHFHFSLIVGTVATYSAADVLTDNRTFLHIIQKTKFPYVNHAISYYVGEMGVFTNYT